MPFGAFAPLPLRLGGSAREGWSPEQHARFCADLVALKRVAPLATLLYDTDGSTASVTSYVGQNGSGLDYAPTATANAAGDTSLAWPVPYFEDEYGVQHPFIVRAVSATCVTTVSISVVWQQIASGVRLRTRSHSGGAISVPVFVSVW